MDAHGDSNNPKTSPSGNVHGMPFAVAFGLAADPFPKELRGSIDGHNGVLIASHARRHLAQDDDRMDRRTTASRPARPTTGEEVLRKVDPSGSVSFAGTTYRAGNRYIGHVVGVRVVGDTVQVAQDGLLLRTHRARHDKLKEFGALNNPGGRPRRTRQDVA